MTDAELRLREAFKSNPELFVQRMTASYRRLLAEGERAVREASAEDPDVDESTRDFALYLISNAAATSEPLFRAMILGEEHTVIMRSGDFESRMVVDGPAVHRLLRGSS